MQERIEKVVKELPQNFGAALIASPENRFYMLGARSSAGHLLVFADKAYFIIDFRYIEMAREVVSGAEVILQDKADEQIAGLLEKHGVKTLLLEQTLSVGRYNDLAKALPGVELNTSPALTNAVKKARICKTASEIALITTAQEITDAAFTYICQRIAAGRTEAELALEMEVFMRSNGAEGLAFPTIFVSGKNSSLPHGVPGDKIIEKGDFITMDYAARYKGYNTDMTRTVAVGSVTDEMKHVYDTVLTAQLASLDFIREGVYGKDADALARKIIYDAGYEGCFGHSLGHGVGIEVHEAPRLSMTADETDLLLAGMMVTAEPGIYLAGRFGVRIEDSVIVTETGNNNLAKSSKELIIL